MIDIWTNHDSFMGEIIQAALLQRIARSKEQGRILMVQGSTADLLEASLTVITPAFALFKELGAIDVMKLRVEATRESAVEPDVEYNKKGADELTNLGVLMNDRARNLLDDIDAAGARYGAGDPLEMIVQMRSAEGSQAMLALDTPEIPPADVLAALARSIRSRYA